MRTLGMSLSALLFLTCTGCGLTLDSLTRDLTPELQGTHERPSDVARNMAIAHNANLRMLSDDIGRVFLTSTPSTLSPMPVVRLSGNSH